MILAEDDEQKESALRELLPHQQEDFRRIFEAMKDLSVCVRLLDPPLHEFLPRPGDHEELEALCQSLGISESQIMTRIQFLQEQNPMLGHRGCRLGVTDFGIYKMQVQALAKALVEHAKAKMKLELKIMIPLTIEAKELAFLLKPLKEEFKAILDSENMSHLWKWVEWGTMIEIPRACLVADEIAPLVDFFSFGTNDLTQATMGLSRDDAAKFLPAYVEKKLLPKDPFESLDQVGVGSLIALAVEKARSIKPQIDLGVCGEHGGDPESIDFFFRLGFKSVSCSPFRVPIARLAVARTAIGNRKNKKAKKK